MKIEITNPATTTLSEIPNGDIFAYTFSGELYVKTSEISKSTSKTIIVSLRHGNMFEENGSTRVRKVKRIVVELED